MDFILSDGLLWFLEVNTVPGMTTKSIVPQQIRAMGMKPSDVYSLVLEEILGS
jgi:D-alanine-D-alanine ligase